MLVAEFVRYSSPYYCNETLDPPPPKKKYTLILEIYYDTKNKDVSKNSLRDLVQ